MGRLSQVGKAPRLTTPEPVTAPDLEASLARAGAASRRGETTPVAASASLFRTGAGAFFRDQRASRLGDILTIRINIADRANLGNTTTRTRTSGETAGVASLLGLETPLAAALPGAVDPAKLVQANSNSSSVGVGNTVRSEQISMTIAGIVTGVLPNGNLVVRGRQEVRVNFELRELTLSGVIRPEDISRDNSIQHTQIAEARISYGGRGQLTEAQQARWGQQIYDALFPF